jgi:branched-chain amino acid transport system substrate-binding protein
VVGYGSGHVQPALLQAGKLVEGSFALSEWMPDLPKEAAKKFVSSFEAKYKMSPSPSAAQAYVATWAVAEAMEQAKSAKPDAVRSGLSAVKARTGATTVLPSAEFGFDASGQHKVGFVGVQVLDGKFVTVWPPEVAVAKPK